jgi:putative addiction module component (TIGR02574 family)
VQSWRYDKFMDRKESEVLKDALTLPPEVRGALIDALIGSLDQGHDAAAEGAWHEEVHRRLDQIDRGDVRLIPWDEARRQLRSRLEL